MNIHILRHDVLPSTNAEALNQARAGAPEGLCVIADRQTDGRGREGRAWLSEKGGGLYFSIVLRPKLEQRDLPILTLLAAVAVHDTLTRLFDFESDIKWPNDILINDKKVCGILSETCETTQGTAVVVGIGINYNSDDFSDELEDIATSIAAETGAEPDRELILRTLTYFLSAHYDQLIFQGNSAAVLGNWASRSSFFRGKKVRVTTRNGIIEGTTDGLDQNGALLVEMSDGRIAAVTAGDVEAVRLPPDDDETPIEIAETDTIADVKSDDICEND